MKTGTVEENLNNWTDSLVTSIPVAGLISRSPTVYKWKAPFRCWLVREAAFWRIADLLTQSLSLYKQGHGLGARILLRSAFETLATLIYLNHKTQAVLDQKLNFHRFGRETSALALGSRDGSTSLKAINVLNMLDRGEKRYPGLRRLYDALSESAHPNWEGLCRGFSKVDHDEYETRFSNRWMELYGDQHLGAMELCMMTFHVEYDEVWPDLMSKLEDWIVEHDALLEQTKEDALSTD